jgi:hypothetical protein
MAHIPHIPELERHCGSWVVTDRQTGKVIGEFYRRRTVELCAEFCPNSLLIETAAQYLGRINGEIRAAR